MKFLQKFPGLCVWLLASCLVLAGHGASAQSQSPPGATTQTTATTTNTSAPIASTNGTATTAAAQEPSITAPLATAEFWLTHFGTNSWNGTRGWIETGAAYENQLQFANAAEVGLKLWSPATNSGLALADQLLTASIAGTIVSDEVDAAWFYDVKDVQLLAGAGGGYDRSTEKAFPGFFAEGQKKTSANTHLYLRAGMQYEGRKTPGMVILGLGGEF